MATSSRFSKPDLRRFISFDDTFRDRIHAFLKEVTEGVPPDQIDGSGADDLAAQKVIQASALRQFTIS